MYKFIATLIIASFSLMTTAHAARVAAVKDRRVLIMAEGESYSVGQRLPLRDSTGKLRAIVQVRQIKGDRVTAVVVKGKAHKSLTVGPAAGSGSGSSVASRKGGSKKGAWGIMAGFSQNQMKAKTLNGDVSMTGSSFNFSGLYQINLSQRINARLLGGYESLSASGSPPNVNIACNPCKTDIGYIGFQGLIKYNFMMRDSFDLWAGGGLGFLLAMSKNSNIMDVNKISTNQTIIGVIGMDWRLQKAFIPVHLEYAIFPDASGSAASQMILRAGYGWEF